MGDVPFSFVECLADTVDYFRQKKNAINEFFNPSEVDKAENKRVCLLCYESGATKRKCCNQLYCDHCYTKNQACPYCKAVTKQEKMTGATFAVQQFSEHEECRCCLEPGMKRRCCGSYYCDECYYKLPACRGCDAPTGNKPRLNEKWKGSVLSILLSWFTTIFVVCATIAISMVLAANEDQVKVLMSGFKCYGFWKTCTVDKCLDMPMNVAMGIDPLPPLASWRNCDDFNSVAKLINKVCIYDQRLYDSTAGHMGYDLCMDMFQEGLYIFEDTFEHYTTSKWQSNRMVSSPWQNITNGFATPYCGTAQHLGGSNALTFSGENVREATLPDMDMSAGGWLEAEMFISPIGFDVINPKCKSSYKGVIYVEYSIDHGNSWVEMDYFNAWFWRQETFFPTKFLIPRGSHAATASTRFRFRQGGDFRANGDAWGLDNVRVLRYLTENWYVYDLMLQSIATARRTIQDAQCCFDTDWCETRLTLEQMDACTRYEWYNGRHYFIRGAELYIMITLLINVFKWVYLSSVDYFLHGRFPLQDEWEDLTKIDRFMKYLPKRYRPKKDISSLVSNIHTSARLASELSDAFRDDEGEGEVIKSKEDIAAEERVKQIEKKKAAKILKERMKNRNFKKSTVVADEKADSDDDEGLDAQFGAVDEEKPKAEGADELADFKKTNVGMLRIPFDVKVSDSWTLLFRNFTLLMWSIACLWKLSEMSYYVVHQPYRAFGEYPGDMSVTSLGIFFFASFMDFKEIYYCLKKVIPCRQEWVPPITLDLQEDISSLFIGPHVIKLDDISEFTAFPQSFALLMAILYILGCLPWCLVSVILRDQFLDFETMRIVTPCLGAFIAWRAILGPGIFIKFGFSMYYLFSFDPKTRERFGAALTTERAGLGAFWSMVSMPLGMYIIFGIALYDYADVVAQLSLLIGAIFGAFTGCVHSLPIHPWLHLTLIRDGVWMKVKKKQRCPCIYWGAFCTEMHEVDEVFVIWSTDDVRFLNYLKGGVGVS